MSFPSSIQLKLQINLRVRSLLLLPNLSFVEASQPLFQILDHFLKTDEQALKTYPITFCIKEYDILSIKMGWGRK